MRAWTKSPASHPDPKNQKTKKKSSWVTWVTLYDNKEQKSRRGRRSFPPIDSIDPRPTRRITDRKKVLEASPKKSSAKNGVRASIVCVCHLLTTGPRLAQWRPEGEAVRRQHVASEIPAGVLSAGEYGRHDGNNAFAGKQSYRRRPLFRQV